VKISDKVQTILGRAVVESNRLKLTEALDRATYLETNKILEALGGKWDRYAKAHVFHEDPSDVLDRALTSGEVTTAKDLGFFPTPFAIAREVVKAADLRDGQRVLEPSAGDGALIQAAYDTGRELSIYAVEIDRKRAQGLFGRYPKLAYVHDGDFLETDPETLSAHPMDRVIMNPPFGKRVELRHVEHAFRFLREGGKLAAILPKGVMFRSDRRGREFRAWVIAHDGEFVDLPEDAFKPSGTLVRTVLATMERGDFE